MMDVDSDFTFTDKSVAKNYARFYPQWVKNNFKSNQEGKEVGEHQDFVMILCPGQKDEVHRKANDADKREYAQEWADYKNGKEHRISGTPIDLLPGIDSGRLSSLKSLYIYSIEQLAELSDMGMQKVGMGANDLKIKAQQFITRSGSNESLKEENEELKQRMADLEAQIKVLAANQKGKPGRKKVVA